MIGVGREVAARLGKIRITPQQAALGGVVKIAFELSNTAARPQRVRIRPLGSFVLAPAA